MNDNKNVPRSDYSVDEILAEAEIMQGHSPPEQKAEAGAEKHAQKRPAALGADEIAHEAQKALRMEAGGPMPDGGAPEPPERKKRIFRRRKKKREEPPSDDIYYGLQLKSLEEYRKEYEQTILIDRKEVEEEADGAGGKSNYPYLFRKEEGGADLPGTEEEDRRERHERLEKIMSHAGLDAEEMLGPEEGPAPGPEQVAPRPEPPMYPPRPPVRNPEQPPVPPAVEPGPAMEPEIRPPIVEPPLAPAVGEDGGEGNRGPGREEEAPRPSVSAAAEAPQTGPVPQAAPVTAGTDQPPCGSSSLDRPGTVNLEAPPGETPGRDRAGTTPPPIREPAVPPRVKDGIPSAPPRKEPAERPVPQYRAGGLPVQVIELSEFDAVLAAEAASYPEPGGPEPIPFPRAEAAGRAEAASQAPAAGSAEEKPEAAPAPEEESGAQVAEIRPAVFAKEAAPEPARPKKKFRFFGNDEESNEPSEEPEESEAELDDYSGPADAPSVMSDLSSNVRGLLLRFAVTAICCALMLALSILRECSGAVPGGIHKLFEAPTYPIVELFFLLLSCAFCAPAFWNGLRGLFTFQANSDSAAAVAAVAAACQNVAYLIFGPAGGVPLYSPLAAAALFLNTAGKLSMAGRILRNFRFLSSPEQKYAVQLFDDHNTALLLAKNSAIGEPKIAYQSKAPFLRNFLRDSYAPDPSDHISQLTAPAGFLASLGLCIVTAVLTKNAGTALAAFAASACVCVPFANMLSVNLPLARLSRVGAQYGGMAVGWPAVEQFCQTNAVMLGAGDLFPRGTVILSGIQTFAGQRIDEAIVDATALTATAGGPLNDLFSQIVKNRGDFLPHVQRPSYEDGMGISGAVEDRVVLVGNRDLMLKHGIDAPSRDYEEKYIRAGKYPLYLASAGTLVAMFLVSYRSDRRRALELRRMESNGIALIVRTRDPQITPALIAECFGLSRNSVSVLPERLGEVYDGLAARTGGRPEAVLATKGRAVGMLRLLTACVRQRSNISIAVALQVAGAALGFALVAFFAAYAGLSQLSVTSLTLFEAFWTASVIFVPHIRKP